MQFNPIHDVVKCTLQTKVRFNFNIDEYEILLTQDYPTPYLRAYVTLLLEINFYIFQILNAKNQNSKFFVC